MSDLQMDIDTNDLQITSGDLSLATGTTAIQQRLQQALQLWLGEWFLDTTVGVPYKQQILVKNPNIDLVQADLVAAASDVPGIIQITDFSLEYSATNRSVSVYIEAQDSNGQTITAQANVGTNTTGTIEGTPY
jgi:hypothetical protein